MLRPLRQEAEFTVYRGINPDTLTPIVALAAARQASPQTVRRLEHEWSLAAELDPAWAAIPVALTRDSGRTTLFLHDPGGEPLDQLIAANKHGAADLAQCLQIAVGLAVALDRVHRRGLIHRDVKPSNTLVDRSGRVWLMGFGIASRLLREKMQPLPPEVLAGTLAYMSPEQTGRMNRSVDARSDLYSLGVTLYELFTGALPFTASDPMEWVHCHIARQAVPPQERSPDIPAAVSSIVMKLLSKTAETRYQTASAVERDLRRCLDQWSAHHHIDSFQLGESDVPDRLLIPEKLYGRQPVVDSLLACFDKIVGGARPELFLVSGHSGVGKSSVVNEMHKALAPSCGHFASGKFDQYKHDIPYATVASALATLTSAILTKQDHEVRQWREAIEQALDADAQLMVDLIPDLHLIIGEQRPVTPLPPREAQMRFQSVFRRFVDVFTRDEPLALFLDDLQWIDAATLDLIEYLLSRTDITNLFLIGAYRKNEVSAEHPLVAKLDLIRQAGARVHELDLQPLQRRDLEMLLADTLHCGTKKVAALARLLQDKTEGNPFFAIQFLESLFEEGLVAFDHVRTQWSWDLKRIKAKGYTENVADLMATKLNRLPTGTLEALQELACIGNNVDFSTLRLLHQDRTGEIDRQLWRAVRRGLIFRLETSYRFSHDRVQEAAYSTIHESLRSRAHYRIGTLMVENTSSSDLDEYVFEIANQLNRGASLAASIAERERIAQLNLLASVRAKASAAYVSAISYLTSGRRLLSDETWGSNEDLMFGIESLLAECEMLNGSLRAAENRLTSLSRRPLNSHRASTVARLQLTLYNLMDRSDRGIEVFVRYQHSRGETWTAHPTEDEAAASFARTWATIKKRKVEELVDLPLVGDSGLLDALDVYTEAVLTAQFTDEHLHALILCRIIDLSLRHGNSDASSFAFVTLGVLAGPQFDNYVAGYQLGELGYNVVVKHGLVRFRARVFMRFGNLVIPWKRHIRAGRDLVRRAFDEANRSGDLTFAAYSCTNLYTNMLFASDSLSEVQREAEQGLEFARKLRFGRAVSMIETQLMFIRTLRGLTEEFGSFNDDRFNEAAFVGHLSGNPTLARPECWYWIRKLQALYYAGDYDGAIEASENAARLFTLSQSYFDVVEYHFFRALALAGAVDSTEVSQRQPCIDAIREHYRKLKKWAEICPENFQNCACLIEAEIARMDNRVVDAEHAYEEAIRSAQLNGFMNNEATANELAGRFYAARGFDKTARAYLRDASNGYSIWGADGKVRQLQRTYPHLADSQGDVGLRPTIVAPTFVLDLATIAKLTQAISSEIFLPTLIERLVRLAVENAGARRGLLILMRRGTQTNEAIIEAQATEGPDGISVVLQQASVSPSDLPRSVLDYVLRTGQVIAISNASNDKVYSTNEYVRRTGARSLLFLPLQKQNELRGVLYLENNLVPGVFTSARVALLQLLASQAAISLENATLYTDLQRSEAFLAQGQKISRTGSFGWSASNGEHYWSEQGYEIAGYDRRTKPSIDLLIQRVHPEDRESVREALESSIRDKTAFESEHRFLMPDGRIKYIYASGRTINIGNLDFIGAIRDVTEHKRAEEELRQAMTDLARINRSTTMGELAASLAHELNQPITGAISYAGACLRWLARENPDLRQARDAALHMVQDGRRAADIVLRIRKQFEKGALNREPLDVADIVRDTVSLLSSETERYGISVTLELAPELPRILGDRVQLQQVAMNLILNAIEAVKDIRTARKITIKSWTFGTDIFVSVRDSGSGVPRELSQQIFEPFFTTKPHGTGMGLRISRSIIESHGGRLWLAEIDQSSEFRISLPTIGN
ncbi:AAA family ATPase [Caballeronia novacaledonica]|uniref:histidine kinase n=1 Tax=Caballeronia novacaledonica TaxID=1544861 RepID=A0AA37MIS4_9BURK|nr:AAA family ATPase [Caballeronia novacaledonica]GJH28980.1 AAA family ATPase [Caballeronia novacaledonica]